MQRGRKLNRRLDVWVGTIALNLLATFRRRRDPPLGALRRVGVMCSPALGDTLLFSGVLQDLRAALPGTEITHICMRQNLAAAEILPGADRRLLVSLTRPMETIRALRRENFDAMLDFTSWQRLTACYTLLSGARYTVGFHTPGQRRSRGYDRTVEHCADRHETGNFRNLLLGSGLTTVVGQAHRPAIKIPAVVEVPFASERDLIALHLWASGQRAHLREWPEERWLELGQRLASEQTLFLVTGAPSDRGRIEGFVGLLRAAGLRAQSFVSPDGFRTLTHVLRQCRLVVTVNTGVMHLAAIAGAPTVAINGPNRNGRWGPVGPCAIGVEAPGSGCGFLHLGFEFDGRAEDCMERTSVDLVFAACRNLLASTGGEVPAPASSMAEVASCN
ncbi:MAG TPA: glycosyltransferase family 9 protein [Acidobacteriaceae bacterium]|nr:glycosyltransferase family 9 protein [Acidobacteriaceae bacterium]